MAGRLPEAQARFDKARQWQAAGRRLDAARCYMGALELFPGFFEAAYNLGLLFQEMGQVEEAIACYRQAVGSRPDFAMAWSNLGVACRDAGRIREALDCFHQALRLRPGAPDALNNLGNALRDQLDHGRAIACFQEALRQSPADAEIHLNLGNAWRENGNPAEAAKSFGRAIQLRPDFPEAHWDLAFALLLQGDFLRGFEEYEWRWRRARFAPRQFAFPAWRGEDPRGRTLLVYAEQGAGDAIQFVRLVTALAARGARLVLECPASLVALFESVEGADRVIARGESLPGVDWHVPLLSLPHLLRVTLDTLPAKTPYLRPPSGREARLPAPPGSQTPQLKAGLIWRGNPEHKNDRHRSIPAKLLEPLLDVPGVAFYSLQVGASPDEPLPGPPLDRLIDLRAMIHDFGDTAVLMKQLDLVISVDTSTVHLAGALGQPAWLLLPCAPDWRWLLGRNDSPWYPSLRLFRQPLPGDWASVVREVRAALCLTSGALSVGA
ncbi:MAG: tetratricopeptide repeat-containing glycosyltransferase family protein [Verrucomicrobiota bacterium]|jgi:tetratricopeptide (TPR) repeat protein